MMNKKKSMGSNPLAYNFLGNASFDFIKKTDGEEAKASETKKSEVKEEETDKHPNKKVVSYYLEEDLIDKISALADEYNQSKSAFVNDLISKKLPNK